MYSTGKLHFAVQFLPEVELGFGFLPVRKVQNSRKQTPDWPITQYKKAVACPLALRGPEAEARKKSSKFKFALTFIADPPSCYSVC